MLRTENPTLLVSKAESGYIDAAIISQEMADALELKEKIKNVTIIRVSEETDMNEKG